MYSFKIVISKKGLNLARILPVHKVVKSDFYGTAYKSLGISLASQYVLDYFNKNEVYETELEAKMEFNKKMIEVTNQKEVKLKKLSTKIENLKRREYNL